MPFICKMRTDIPDGVLQVLDLRPNTSQRSLIYEPAGQTKYINRVQNDTVALTGNNTSAQYMGLAAYLIDNVIDGVTAVTITPAVANAAAIGLIAIMDAGTALTEALVNADIIATGGAGAGTDINGGGSTGVLTDILGILAGRQYVLPAASTVGALAAGAGLGAFTAGQFRHTFQTGSLEISLDEGVLFQLTAATYTHVGVAGQAVVVYDDVGNVMT